MTDNRPVADEKSSVFTLGFLIGFLVGLLVSFCVLAGR